MKSRTIFFLTYLFIERLLQFILLRDVRYCAQKQRMTESKKGSIYTYTHMPDLQDIKNYNKVL